jgi:hypothetical protein
LTRSPSFDTIVRVRAYLAIFAASLAAATIAACGARSGLPIEETRHRHDAGPDAHDAAPDVEDAGPDVHDALDAGPDVEPDVVVNDCADAGITYIYVITEENDRFAFYPPNKDFFQIGTIDCNDPGTPFSMAVDRAGVAYVLHNSGNLYRVSTANASCKPTSFVKGQNGYTPTFGMGFSSNDPDPGETLYVASDFSGDAGPERLATIDPQTFDLTVVGPFSEPIGNAELTGTGDAKLFAFGVEPTNNGTVFHLAQLDKATADVIDDKFLQLPSMNLGISAWAFAYWGGDFYFFTSTMNGQSSVTRYHPGDPPIAVPYTMLDRTIVGAGVSTCAPQQ